MKKLYLVRHGETDINRQWKIQGRSIDAPLNATGEAQAEALTAFFKTRPVDVVIASSLQRTHQTATPVAEMKGLAIRPYKELDEMDFGDLEGLPVDEAGPLSAGIKEKWEAGNTDVPVQNGESPDQVFERASTRILQLLNDQTEKNWLFVLHGRLMRILLSGWLHGDLRYMEKVRHANGAINVLQYNNGNFEPLLLHYTSHLNLKPEIQE